MLVLRRPIAELPDAKKGPALAIIVAPKAPRKKLSSAPHPGIPRRSLASKSCVMGYCYGLCYLGGFCYGFCGGRFVVWNRDGSLMAATERHAAKNALMPPLQDAFCGSGRMRILPGAKAGRAGRAGRAWVR